LSVCALALLGFTASEANAQACFGVPTVKSNTAAYAAIGFPDFATDFHVGGAMKFDGPFAAGASFTHRSYDHGLGSSNSLGVTGAYNLELDESSPVSICPLGNVGFHFSDGSNVFSLGAGAGVSTELPISDGEYSLYPYAVPQIVHTNGDGFSDTRFNLGLGANFGFSKYYVGAQFAKAFGLPGSDFRIQAGLNF
jgi:hypothetical protein